MALIPTKFHARAHNESLYRPAGLPGTPPSQTRQWDELATAAGRQAARAALRNPATLSDRDVEELTTMAARHETSTAEIEATNEDLPRFDVVMLELMPKVDNVVLMLFVIIPLFLIPAFLLTLVAYPFIALVNAVKDLGHSGAERAHDEAVTLYEELRALRKRRRAQAAMLSPPAPASTGPALRAPITGP